MQFEASIPRAWRAQRVMVTCSTCFAREHMLTVTITLLSPHGRRGNPRAEEATTPARHALGPALGYDKQPTVKRVSSGG